jgi:hypothetical protein
LVQGASIGYRQLEDSKNKNKYDFRQKFQCPMKKNVQELLLEPAPLVVVFVILTTLEFASIDGM